MATGPTTIADVLAMPAVVDLRTAAQALNMGRTTAYQLARSGEFPCRVLKIGAGYRVPTAGLLALLGLADAATPTEPTPATGMCDTSTLVAGADGHRGASIEEGRLPGR